MRHRVHLLKSFRSYKNQGKEQEALQILEYAAQNGNHAAQWKLGRMYQTGDGVPHNHVEAFNFFQKLTEGYRFLQPTFGGLAIQCQCICCVRALLPQWHTGGWS